MATLSGKNILVIGGSSGIGYATAVGALAQGAKVTIASRSEEKLRAAKASLQGQVEARALDVADTAAVKAFFDASPAYDHVVVSGAAFKFGTVREQDIDDAYAAMNVKFWGAYRVARFAKLAPDGSMVFVSGFLSRRPKPKHPARSRIPLAGLPNRTDPPSSAVRLSRQDCARAPNLK